MGLQDKLRELGWRVLVLWECALPAKGKGRLPEADLLAQIADWLKSDGHYLEIPSPVTLFAETS